MQPRIVRNPLSDSVLSRGRPGDVRLGEWVRPINAMSEMEPANLERVVLFGCPDDQGVLLNRGRAGAKDGPDSIRRHLYKMTMPMDFLWETGIALYDFGNIVPSHDVRVTHERAQAMAQAIAETGAVLIALGGGHDFAAPDFFGFAAGYELAEESSHFGLINVDPHLDVRTLDNDRPHSGTPFRQILESGKLSGSDFVEFGARANRNARLHFEYCQTKKVTIRTFEKMRASEKAIAGFYKADLSRLTKTTDAVVATFDIDSCSDAEGMSAAPVLGFSAWELFQMAEIAGRDGKVRMLEICEVAPSLDPAERSSRIAAEMIFSFLRGRSESRQSGTSARRRKSR